MSEISDRLADLLDVPAQPEPAPWRPGVDLDGDAGEIRTDAYAGDTSPQWDDVIAHFGLDPAEFAVVEPVRFSVWDAQVKGGGIQQMRAYRARIVRRRPGLGIDADALIEEIRRHKPRKRPEAAQDGGAFVFVVADTQAGKGDGDGSEGMARRFLTALDAAEARVRELRRNKRALNECVIACAGDLVESCDGHYPAQAMMADLSDREQMRIMRRLILKAVERLAPLFDTVTLAAVAGNHGEYRNRTGKAYQPPESNKDLAIPEQVMEILAANPDAYGHVRGAIGGDPFVRVIEAGGHVLGILHGHMARESGSAQQKIARWYERQAAARAPIGAADVVLSGHYHHFTMTETNGTVTFLQAPSLDGGSDWYAAQKAAQHNPGLLTFALYPDNRRVADIAIL